MQLIACPQFLALTLAVLAGIYVLGEGWLRLCRTPSGERYFRWFLALLTGLTLLVVSYAAVLARGRTVLLPLLALVLAVGWQLRQPPDEAADQLPLHDTAPVSPTGGAGRSIGGLLLLVVGLFAVRVGLLYDTASPYLLTPFQDYVYYGRLSAALNQAGIETRSLEQFYPQFTAAQPYHYYELWLNALLIKISGQPAVWCLYLGTYTVLTCLVYVGFRALLAHFNWRGAWATGLATSLMLTSGVCWPLFEHWALAAGGRYTSTSLLLLEPKLGPVYLLLLLTLLLLLRRQWNAVGLALATLPLVFVTTVPAMAGVAAVLVLALWRYLRGRQLALLLLPLGAVLAYMAAFYALQPAAYNFSVTPGDTLVAQLPKVGQWRTLLNIFIGSLLNVALYTGAFAALGLAVGWGRFRLAWQRWPYSLTMIVGLLLTIVVVTTLAYTLANQLIDSYQIMGNILPPLLPLVLAAGLAALLGGTGVGGRRMVAVAGLLALALVNYWNLFSHQHSMHKVTRFAPAFLEQVRAELGRTGPRGGFLMADRDYETIYNLTQDSFTRGTYVANFLSSYALVSLSALDVDSRNDPRFAADTARAAARIRTSSFVRFVKLNALQGRYWSKDSAQYWFVRRHDLRFLCLSPTVPLPVTLRSLVQRSFRDPLSGEVFVTLQSAR